MNDELFDYVPVTDSTDAQKEEVLIQAISLMVSEPIFDATKIAFSNPEALLAVSWSPNPLSNNRRRIPHPLVDPDLYGDLGPIYEQEASEYAINIDIIDPSRKSSKIGGEVIATAAQEWWFETVSRILIPAIPALLLERTALKSCIIPITGAHIPNGLYIKRAIEVPTFDLIGE